MSQAANLKVLLIDPCFSGKGMSNMLMPLNVGLVGSYLKSQLPGVEVTVLKKSTEIVNFIKNNRPDILGICNYLWNSNLGNRLSRYAREVNPKTFIIFGGPESNMDPVNKKGFIKKYKHVDMLVEREGEFAFTKLIKIYLEEGRDVKKVRSRITELGNCFYLNENNEFVSGPDLPRINNLNEIPSPYLTGLFDHFLKDGNYQPALQTNRGCPYKCTFCSEGLGYYNKINYHSLDYVKKELEYIAKRVNPAVGLLITDSNWGMYKQDVEIAYYLKELIDKYKWPKHIICSTGKSQLSRIKQVAEIVEGALSISNAVQSLNNDVLDTVKRKNANNLQEFMSGLSMASAPDIILPLPKETKKTFLDGLNSLLDTKAPMRFTVYPALLLSHTEMNTEVKQKKHRFKLRYRQHQNLVEEIAGEIVCETEYNIFATSSMNVKDVMESRKYVVLMYALLRQEPLLEIFYYLDSNEIKRSTFTMSLFESLNTAPKVIQKCFNDYVEAWFSECFETEEEVFDFMKKYSKDYTYGKKGGDLLRYSQKLWIDYYDDMMKWIFKHLHSVCGQKKETKEELLSLRKYLDLLNYERSKNSINKKIIKKKFKYDILSWVQESQGKKLGDYKKNVVYTFEETKFSKQSKASIWKSFGFNLSEKDVFNNQYFNRLWMSRTQRKLSSSNKDTSKKKLSHRRGGYFMSSIANEIGL